jgi:energy-converting hydrogenase Eha subunit A
MRWRVAAVIGAVAVVVGAVVRLVLGLGERRPAREKRQQVQDGVQERLIALGVGPKFVKVTGDRGGGPDLCHVSLTVDQWDTILGAKASDEPSGSSETSE